MADENNISPFEREKQTHIAIHDFLKKNPRGTSTQEIENGTGISRKAVEKHLQMLLFENEIYMKQFGSTRVYYPNHRHHHIDFRHFDFGKKRFYFDIIENDYGKSLLIQQKVKENDKFAIKGSVFIPLEASQDFMKTLKEVLSSDRIKKELETVS